LYTSFALKEDGSSHTCVLDYIIAREKKFSCVCVLPGETLAEERSGLVAVINFDTEHCWLEKLVDDRWYVMDSRDDCPRQIKKPQKNGNLYQIFVYLNPKEAKAARVERKEKKKEKKKEKSESSVFPN
jgi:hypothetical protein